MQYSDIHCFFNIITSLTDRWRVVVPLQKTVMTYVYISAASIEQQSLAERDKETKTILKKVLNSFVNLNIYPLCQCKNVESHSSLRMLI